VPITLRHSEELELNLVEYRDAITMAELERFAEFNGRNVESMTRDCLNIVMPGASFSGVDAAALDGLFARYANLYAPLNFQIIRRAAWICLSQLAAPHVRHWLGGDARSAMSSAVRQFDSFLEAAEWLVLSPAEMAEVERGEGFVQVAHFETVARAR
jgi:hypothetical protein